MKAVVTTLVLTMLIAGCAEKERYAERYLDTIGLVLHIDRPAEVAGLLRQGTSPGNTLEYSDLSGISRLVFSCSPEDSIRLIEQLDETEVPIEVSTDEYNQIPSVEYWQEGITWRPRYHWTINGSSCLFTANVVISNSTGREWFSRSTVMSDFSDNPVCLVSDTLIVRGGDMELGWWSASGEVLPLTLKWGWPVSSEWNQLVPCIIPEAGQLVEGTIEWPRRTGETLWVRPDTELEIVETVHQNTTGYDCTLQIYNQTDRYTELRIVHPERTPRGAVFETQDGFPSMLGLQPGDLIILEYRITYD